MQSFEINKADLERIKAALESDDAELVKVLQEYHASEIAILFEKLPVEAREKIINILPSDVASEVFAEMHEEQDAGELLISLDPEKRSEIIEELDYDDATDIISQLEEHEQQEILEDIDQEDAIGKSGPAGVLYLGHEIAGNGADRPHARLHMVHRNRIAPQIGVVMHHKPARAVVLLRRHRPLRSRTVEQIE